MEEALLLCSHFIAIHTSKDDIKGSAIWYLRRFILIASILVGLHNFPLSALVTYPVILRSTLLHRG